MLPLLLAVLGPGTSAWGVDSVLTFDPAAAQGVWRGLEVKPVTDPARQAWAVAARAMARYPAASLARRLERVVVVERASFEGVPMGGTSDRRRRLLLTIGLPGMTETYVTDMFHHELAHALQGSLGQDFPASVWWGATAPGLRYGRSGFDAARARRTSLRYDPAYAAKGVLSEYGASAPEEDWATISAAVVQEDPRFWALARRFPRLLAKGRLAARFYRRAFPGMRVRDAGPGDGPVEVGATGRDRCLVRSAPVL